MSEVEIVAADPVSADVVPLLVEHLSEMYATSPPESVHALDAEQLRHPSISFFVARQGGAVIGTGAIRELNSAEGELKSMRTAAVARGHGVGARMLEHLLAVARSRGYRAVRLETGAEDYFEPARRLYARSGFVPGEPFAHYRPDPNSVFLHLELGESPLGRGASGPALASDAAAPDTTASDAPN
ncbi:MAG: GNAT family N-acetyltransferase [Rhodoglobus sp.]